MTLEALGLSRTQEQVYRRLTASPDTDLSALAAACDLPPGAVRTALDALHALELVDADPDSVLGLRARRPSLALGALATRQAEALGERMRALIELQGEAAALDTLRPEVTPTRPAEHPVEVLDGVGAVDAKLEELADAATHSMDSVAPGSQTGLRLPTSMPLTRRSLRHGVTMRWIIEPSRLATEAGREFVGSMTAAGVLTRVTAWPVSRLIVVDDAQVLTPRVPGHPESGAVLITHPALVAGYRELFDAIWNAAFEISEHTVFSAACALSLSADDCVIVAHLARGATDEAIARQVGLSSRQVRRRIAGLLDRLGARSRFEAGILAERYGLLRAEPPAP